MAHPSESLPKNMYILNGANDLALTDGRHVFAIYNPTAAAVTVDITGSITNYSSGDSAYVETSSEVASFPIPSGGTLYGRFPNVGASAGNVVCYVA